MPVEPEPGPSGLMTRAQINDLITERGISPVTRRLIIWSLAAIAVLCIGAEVALAYLGKDGSDALMAIAASCVGGLGGMATPQRGSHDG